LYSRQYTVTVKLKDDGLLKKLEGVSGGSAGGGGNKNSVSGLLGGGGGGGGIFKKLEGIGIGQLLKLGGIAAAVTTMVALTYKSSAQLQGIHKMWEAGFMLIFKPFGDFIAQLFRPMTIMFLQFAVPFYKEATKFFRDWLRDARKVSDDQINTAKGGAGSLGTAEMTATGWIMQFFGDMQRSIGKTFDTQAKDVSAVLSGAVTGIATTWKGFNDVLGSLLTPIPSIIVGAFTSFGSNVASMLSNIPGLLSSLFLNFGANVWNNLLNLPSYLSGLFTNFGQDVWNKLLDVPGTLFDVFMGLAGNIGSRLAGIPDAIWAAIMNAVNRATGGLVGGTSAGGGAAAMNVPSTIHGRTTMAGIADTLG
jgi:hypothetical protein